MKIKTIVYTLMTKTWNFVFATMKQPKIKDIKLQKYYQDLSLPFRIYIDIVVSKDVTKLIIEGNPTLEELSNTWQNINELLIDAIGDLDTKIKIENAKDIAFLEGRIFIANTIIKQLEYNYNEDLVKLLQDYGYLIALIPNETNIDKYIKMFLGHLKSDIIKLQEKIGETKDEKKSTTEINLQYFEKIIVAIELTFKKDIDIDKITTGKYCEYVNSYNQHIKNLQKQINKNK